jgi:hypothetical protein
MLKEKSYPGVVCLGGINVEQVVKRMEKLLKDEKT